MRNCIGCGVEQTDENSYRRDPGKFLSKCKKCTLEEYKLRRKKNMSEERRLYLIDKYENLLRELRS